MSNYTRLTNFTAKDALASGNPSKIILGSEHQAEYDAIATAIATKLDDINSLSAETTVDTAADYLPMYDNSAGSSKKVLAKHFVSYIGTYTASATATLDIETGIDSSKFCGYILNIIYLYPATNATTLKMRIKRGGAYQTTSYSTMLGYYASSATNTFNNTAAVADCWELALSASSTGASAFSGIVRFTNPHDATSYLVASGNGTWQGSGGNTNVAFVNGYYGSGGVLEGIRFLSSSGNITGKIILHGIRL